MPTDSISYCLNDLFGRSKLSLPQQIEHVVIAQLFLPAVFGFVQSVGIDKEWTALDCIDFLILVL